MDYSAIEKAKEYFGQIVSEQLKRVEEMKQAADWVDYSQLKPIIIGIIGGDGIGPYIAKAARRVLEFTHDVGSLGIFSKKGPIDSFFGNFNRSHIGKKVERNMQIHAA